jgi:hypothetical protein
MRSSRSGSLFVATLLAALAVSGAARAQGKSQADVLFDEGTALMNAGKYAEACPKLEQSLKLDPGVGGMLWLADCYERAGRTASAYNQYKAAEKLAADTKDPKGRDKVANKHAAALEPKLSKLILMPPTPLPAGLEITRDGEKVDVTQLGVAIIVDPGAHAIVVNAPGSKRWEKNVDVPPDGGTASVVLVVVSETKVEAPPPPPEPSDPGTPLRIGGLVVAGVGLVGVGLGTAFGVIASGKLSDSNADNHCDAQNTCDATGLGLRSDAQSAATISTVGFIAGAVLIAGGITMFVLAPKKSPAQTALAPAIGGGFYGAALFTRF